MKTRNELINSWETVTVNQNFQARTFLHNIGEDEGGLILISGSRLLPFGSVTLRIVDSESQINLTFRGTKDDINNNKIRLAKLREALDMVENFLEG